MPGEDAPTDQSHMTDTCISLGMSFKAKFKKPFLLYINVSVDDEIGSEMCDNIIEFRKEKRERKQEELREKILKEKRLRADLVQERKQIKYISKSTPLSR